MLSPRVADTPDHRCFASRMSLAASYFREIVKEVEILRVDDPGSLCLGGSRPICQQTGILGMSPDGRGRGMGWPSRNSISSPPGPGGNSPGEFEGASGFLGQRTQGYGLTNARNHSVRQDSTERGVVRGPTFGHGLFRSVVHGHGDRGEGTGRAVVDRRPAGLTRHQAEGASQASLVFDCRREDTSRIQRSRHAPPPRSPKPPPPTAGSIPGTKPAGRPPVDPAVKPAQQHELCRATATRNRLAT